MTIKIGASTWIWTSPLTTADVERLAPHAVGMGFDLLELPVESPNDFDYAQAARVLDRAGLGRTICAAMGPDRDLIHPDTAIRENGLAYIRHCIDAAATVGAQNVIGPIYSAVGRTWQSTGQERERDTELLVRQLSTLAAYGVTLCIEPLNRFETSFLNTVEQAIPIIDRVDSPACGLLLDTFHMNIEEQSVGAVIRAAEDRVRHFHASENDRGTSGAGHVPWQEAADALGAIGYSGPVIIETFTDKVTAIAAAAAIWRPLAESQDKLAQDGLAFLRELFV
jgi:D-psicose/D-tagatose/L-ribulose 3-epimerase